MLCWTGFDGDYKVCWRITRSLKSLQPFPEWSVERNERTGALPGTHLATLLAHSFAFLLREVLDALGRSIVFVRERQLWAQSISPNFLALGKSESVAPRGLSQ